ncbi:hypothetical protein CLAIMM_15200 [Cladophialophora immunda]|nr:hypothetical protein CLAIMM_15200 [Cladophialophora immunda]
MKSTDSHFKANRALLKDLMTPGFLNEVEAPQVYRNAETLVDLWNLKCRLADGRPFKASTDIYNAALDTVFAATFGLEARNNTTTSQLQQLLKHSPGSDIDKSMEQTVIFSQFPRPAIFDAIIELTESLETAVKAPFPRLGHWLLRWAPRLQRARAVTEWFIRNEVESVGKRVLSGDYSRTERSALGDILQRELSLSKKEGRQLNFHSRSIYDEVFGFIIAGHDSSSTTLCWDLKHFAVFQDAQGTLRLKLRTAYAAATKARRNPTAEEIALIQVPYLDAALEEMVRTVRLLPGIPRTTMTDVLVMGYTIPKGINIWLLQTGPGYFTPALPVPDTVRSPSSLQAKYDVGTWDPTNMDKFLPERWLVKGEDGQEVFNPHAGPQLSFGLGPRACFGRRLAYLQMRIILVLMIWNFELLPLPQELSSFQAVDRMIIQPVQTHVRLKKVV